MDRMATSGGSPPSAARIAPGPPAAANTYAVTRSPRAQDATRMMLYRDHRVPLTSAQQARQMHAALARSTGWARVLSTANQSR